MAEANGTNGNGHAKAPRKRPRKLSPEQASELCRRWAYGEPMTRLAAEFHISVPTGYACVDRELA